MTNNKFPQNIIFDLGGVLLDIDISLSIKAFEKLGIQAKQEDIHPNNTGVFITLEKGEISDDEFAKTLIESVKGANRPTKEQVFDAWNELLLPYKWERFEMLDTLREKGHKVFLLSNTNHPHHVFFEDRFDREHPQGRTFRSFFDGVFYSDEMKMRKPEKEIYQKVQQIIGSPSPQEILFIDDNAPNLEAPSHLGWQTHLHNPKSSIIDFFKGV